MSVALRKRKNADGTTSLRLDIYYNGKRTIETLQHLKLSKGFNVADRESNKEMLQKAEAIRLFRNMELEGNNYNMASDSGKKTIVVTWMQSFVDLYAKKDKRNMQGALNKFSKFLTATKNSDLTFGNLTAVIVEEFIEYLEGCSTGEGASSYFNRFRRMIKHAYRKKILRDNIFDQVERKVKGKAKKKDILTLKEITILNAIPISNLEIKKGFLFSCMTGLRWCDIKTLKWSNIDLNNKLMNIYQSKTNERVVVSLNDTAIGLLGKHGKKEEFVFVLPSANGANKAVKNWVKSSGINKVITWHNARHSFGTNLCFTGADVLTASKLMGHTSVKHTMRYVAAADELKQTATDKLNFNL